MKIQFKSDLKEKRSGKTADGDLKYALLCVVGREKENWKSTKENPTVTKLLVCLIRRRVNFDVNLFNLHKSNTTSCFYIPNPGFR